MVDRCDCHPDEFTEYIRWLICEGELLQGLGRMRAVNRDADTPVDIDISNVVLPIDVDEAMQWRTPSELIETAMEGHMPTAPVDMMKLRPGSYLRGIPKLLNHGTILMVLRVCQVSPARKP